jgi:hypothetical protein
MPSKMRADTLRGACLIWPTVWRTCLLEGRLLVAGTTGGCEREVPLVTTPGKNAYRIVEQREWGVLWNNRARTPESPPDCRARSATEEFHENEGDSRLDDLSAMPRPPVSQCRSRLAQHDELLRPPRNGRWNPSSSVQLQDYVSLTGPVGSLTEFAGTLAHPILMTARIPLSAFGNADLSQVRGVRFTFDDTKSDEIYIANIRASSVGSATSFVAPAALPTDDTVLPTDARIDQNAVSSITTVASEAALRNQPGVEISLNSNRPFLPAGEILVLRVGDQEFGVSRYSEDGSTNQVRFVLTQAQFASLKQGDQISVQYGDGGNGNGWT